MLNTQIVVHMDLDLHLITMTNYEDSHPRNRGGADGDIASLDATRPNTTIIDSSSKKEDVNTSRSWQQS